MPANTTVVLDIQSTDVIHSWWVPSLGGKVDAVPGYTTYTGSRRRTPGPRSTGQCASCAAAATRRMTALVKVLSPGAYKAWLRGRTR